jgi:hypothetical protein
MEGLLRSKWDSRKNNYTEATFLCLAILPPLAIVPAIIWMLDRRVTQIRIEKLIGSKLDQDWDEDDEDDCCNGW